MNPSDYQRLAMRTKCDQLKPLDRLGTRITVYNEEGYPVQVNPAQLNHAVVGMTGDVGELASALEKFIYYGQDFDRVNIIEELGDIMWYIAEACSAVGVPLEYVMGRNIAKLRKRYPEKFNELLAKEENRDREAERKALMEFQIKSVNEAYKRTFPELDSNKLSMCYKCKQPLSDELPNFCPNCGHPTQEIQG